jgi:Leucine-rich repeat (LRR) protein
LRLNRNRIRDIGPLSGLSNLQYLYLDSNQVNDINPLSGLTALDWLGMNSNIVFDVCPLLDNAGIAAGDTLDFKINPLSETSISECIPALQAKGVTVLY